MLIGRLKKWYRYFLFCIMLLIMIMCILQLARETRLFSIIYILLIMSIVISANYSFIYFEKLTKILALLMIASGGMILLSTIIYLLTGAQFKISIEGNIIGLITFGNGFVLYKYFDRSIISTE